MEEEGGWRMEEEEEKAEGAGEGGWMKGTENGRRWRGEQREWTWPRQLAPPCGNSSTYVTGMTEGVTGLFTWPPARCDGWDSGSGQRQRRRDSLHFHLSEKSG